MACGDCIAHQIGSSDLVRRINAPDAPGREFPTAGSLELTLDCNLWCRHCYIRYPGATDNEMSTEEVKAVLDKLADNGVLFLLLTGGEIFARPDFREIYLHAKRCGFLLTLFTNATKIDDNLADFLALWPPRRIEITVYGHTEAVYERVTGVAGSFAAFRAGIERLRARRLPLYLKMMVMKSNVAEFELVRDWAQELGAPFRHDTIVNPRLDGHKGVLRERLHPTDVVRIGGTGDKEKKYYQRMMDLALASTHNGQAFRCGAGVRTFHVDPRGQVHPCMMYRSKPYDLRHGDLGGWARHLAEVRSARMPEGSACGSCRHSTACNNCAAASELENGEAGRPVPYLCGINNLREKLLRLDRRPATAGSTAAA